MNQAFADGASLPLQRLPLVGRWGVLTAASVLIGAGLQEIGLPAALMLGPLAAAVLAQTAGGPVKIPSALLAGAQAVIGCLVARSITPAIVHDFLDHWPSVVAVVALSVVGSAAMGWTMARWRVIPGTTAIWGMLPGAATVMMVMAEAYGADARLVAFMQYLRVVLVAAAASVVALLVAHGGSSRFAAGYLPPVDLPSFAITLAVASIGGGVGLVSQIPAGVLLGPLALGAVLSGLGYVRIELPPVLLIASFALIGWNIGLRFTRDVLAVAARALPQSFGAVALLMGFCGLLSWMLVRLLQVDPLTAYLAASPGGVDAAAVIAASTKVDMPFVMVVQTVRVVVLLSIGPRLAQWLTGTLKADIPASTPPKPPDLGDLD
jgi:uncharacterized protein